MRYKLHDDMKLWAERGDILTRQIIMDTYPELDRFVLKLSDSNMHDFLERARQRDKVIASYGFAIPCQEAIDIIRNYQPIIEVGAGTGYWTWLLNHHDINCIASDPGLSYQDVFTHANYDCEFHKLTGSEAVEKYPTHNILMIWPSYHENWAENVLKAMKPGQTLIYIGENRGGCCATDKFFNLLELCFNLISSTRLPQWDGIHDYLSVLKRK